jgi:hypothetical protein
MLGLPNDLSFRNFRWLGTLLDTHKTLAGLVGSAIIFADGLLDCQFSKGLGTFRQLTGITVGVIFLVMGLINGIWLDSCVLALALVAEVWIFRGIHRATPKSQPIRTVD